MGSSYKHAHVLVGSDCHRRSWACHTATCVLERRLSRLQDVLRMVGDGARYQNQRERDLASGLATDYQRCHIELTSSQQRRGSRRGWPDLLACAYSWCAVDPHRGIARQGLCMLRLYG